jgi:glycosyltransferase involved in cell wall biosynthesis
MKQLLCIVTGGPGDGLRARRLTAGLDAEVTYLDIDKSQPRRTSSSAVWQALKSRNWDLVYQEGTGVVGGANLIRAKRRLKLRYVVSSGDPIAGFFRTTKGPIAGAAFAMYERLLYKNCAGYIGWTPYLTGMAIQMGVKRAATVEGAVDLERFFPYADPEKHVARERFGVAQDHLVCGVVGSLRWTPRQSYCYGLELVETLKLSRRADLSILIVGDGSGLEILRQRVPEALRSRVVFTGRLAEAEVVAAMNAMDIGFITQTLDQLGNFRLTTKLPEYLACGLPVAMSPVPGFFDYAAEAGWALPAFHPSSQEFHIRCAKWLDQLCCDMVKDKANQAREIAQQRFSYVDACRKFQLFTQSIMYAEK